MQQLQQQAMKTMRNIWANSTWANRASLVHRLERFRKDDPMLAERTDNALDWSIVLFVESTQTIASSKLTYVKHLLALYRRQEHQLPICSIYATALRGLGSVPMHQARPALHTNIDRMLMRAAAESTRLQTAIFIAWKTASRWDEISRLTKESFILVTEKEIIVEWMNNTKTTRLDPWRSSTWTVIAHPAPMTQYVEVINSLQPEETLTPFSTTQFVDWMQKDLSTRHLSAQSIKRGALTLLVQFVLAGQLDIALVPRMAKHKMVIDALPATTFRYLDDKVSLARLMKTQDASICLPCLPHVIPMTLDELLPDTSPFPAPASATTTTRVAPQQQRPTSSKSRNAAPPMTTTMMMLPPAPVEQTSSILARVRARRQQQRQEETLLLQQQQQRQQQPPAPKPPPKQHPVWDEL